MEFTNLLVKKHLNGFLSLTTRLYVSCTRRYSSCVAVSPQHFQPPSILLYHFGSSVRSSKGGDDINLQGAVLFNFMAVQPERHCVSLY